MRCRRDKLVRSKQLRSCLNWRLPTEVDEEAEDEAEGEGEEEVDSIEEVGGEEAIVDLEDREVRAGAAGAVGAAEEEVGAVLDGERTKHSPRTPKNQQQQQRN